MNEEIIVWTLQTKTGKFGFVIPDERDYFGGDFFVVPSNFNGANDWDRVEARELMKSKWKKPEAKIIKVLSWVNKIEKKEKSNSNDVIKVVEGIYSWWDWNFGFIDVEWQEKWFFVYWHKKNWARDGDKVKADIIIFKDKEEAIVTEIIWGQAEELLEWVFRDNDRFWFVVTDNWSWDIFIAGSRKWSAQNWERVEVRIIKRWGKNPEGVITRVL